VKVDEGRQFRLGKLVIEERVNGKEVTPLGGKAGLQSRFTLHEGDVFARDVIVRDLQEIRRVYRDAGYANVQADPETTLDAARAIVDVKVPIRRMAHTTIAHVRIVSSDAAKATIRQALHVTEGQAFNETALERTKVQLLALGVFRRVDISLQPVPSDSSITVTIEAEE
jgi:outer membrane protein insertion porin family